VRNEFTDYYHEVGRTDIQYNNLSPQFCRSIIINSEKFKRYKKECKNLRLICWEVHDEDDERLVDDNIIGVAVKKYIKIKDFNLDQIHKKNHFTTSLDFRLGKIKPIKKIYR
jgi:hypothetical protein